MLPEADFRVVYEEWSQGRLTRAGAAARLEVCERTFSRYVARFRAQGSQWWIDRSNSRPSSRRASDGELARLEMLYAECYAGWNTRHFYERYRSAHGGKRSYTWVKNSLQAAGLVEKRVRDVTPSRARTRDIGGPIGRSPRQGMTLHQVASRREWVARHVWDLIVTADDATNRVCSGFFVDERGIWSIFRAIRETVARRGLFDCLSLGMALPSRLTTQETRFGGRTKPQLKRAMSELGIEMRLPVRQLHARQIRVFGTLLRRLPQELEAEGIADIDGANGFLARFWRRFNDSLAAKVTESTSAFVPLDPSFLPELTDVLCLKHHAKVSNLNRLVCEGKEHDLPGRTRRQLGTGKPVRIHEYEDQSCALFDGGDRVATVNTNGNS